MDELFFWIFEAQAYSRAWQYELAHRHPTQDSRRIAFPKAIEEIEKLNPTWRDRLKQEQDEILRNHPFLDKTSSFLKWGRDSSP
ncbi:Imm63 family immunity protein [Rhizobium sp. 2YAF20]|uniref:Imm63 family immunity protein n=1 Tax=Rhizobium sp. 2YAF20 TaxID=3233027 RepID=UPI003F9E1525